MRLSLGYPNPGDEQLLLNNLRREHPINLLKPVPPLPSIPSAGNDGTLGQLLGLQREVWEVHVDETLQDYIVRLVSATRNHPDLVLGGSPRASLALYKTAQALAAVRGRDHVLPDDIKYLAPVVLPHRLIVRPESELRGRTADQILSDMLKEVSLEFGKI
jgi:MoxR-like ATPase